MRRLFSQMALALCLTFSVCAVSVTIAPADVQAKKPEKAAKASVDDILGNLSWGMDHEAVIKRLSDKMNEDYRAKVKGSLDESYADMMRKGYMERVENMRKSYIQLMKDNVASLSVSIIGEEFMPDNNESMLTQRDDIATKYFFFINDKLYKIAIVYDSNYLGPIAFDTFCATTEAKYGKPHDEVWTDEGDFMESIWKGKSTILNVKNKYASYSTFLMVFSEEATAAPLVAQHKQYYASVNHGPEISADIDLLTADDPNEQDSSVDAILGKKTEVDLLAGLSQQDIDIIQGKTSQKEIEAQKKAKAKKAKASRKKNDAKVKQGLTIY